MPPKRTREGEDKVPADAGADAAAADATALVNLRADADAVECRLVEARGRALVASKKIEKGAVFMSERPIAAVQAVANRAAFASCAHCLAPVGLGATHHLALACGATTRRDLVAAVSSPQGWGRIKYDKPSLPPLPGDKEGALVPCRRARGGCADVFCTARCRADADGWHALTCVGHCEEGSPMYEFRRHAMRTHESFLLAANATARALADAGASDGVGEGESGSRSAAADFDPKRDVSAAAAANIRAITALCAPSEPWWEVAARVAGVDDPDAGSEDPKRKAKRERRLERRAETLREQIEDAWQLLEMSWVRMRGLGKDAETGEPTAVAPLLTFDAFHRLVAAVDNTVLPVGDEHPGAAYARRAAAAEAELAEKACGALDKWLAAVEDGGPSAGDGSDDGSEEDEDDSSEDDSSDESDSDESGPSTPGRSDEDEEEEDEDEDEDEEEEVQEPTATRRADWTERGPIAAGQAPGCSKGAGMLDIVERAGAKLPRLAALALAPGLALVNHSCLPNCQLELTRGVVDDEDEKDEKDDEKTKKPERGADCGGLRVSLLALRDIAPGEELTVGYVPCTQDLASRRADLAARHGFVCTCARCGLESGAGSGANPSLVDMKRLADQAQEEARYEDAEAAARVVLESTPNDGDAHHKIGTAMLGQGRWADAHAAWREGAAAHPDHPALSSQLDKDRAYAPGVPASVEIPSGLGFESVHDAGIWATTQSAPLLTEAECAEWVRVAEKAGAARGGWTTSRHYAVPTTDIPVHAIPHLLPLWNDFMRDKLAPLIASMCPSEMPTPSSVRVHDAFVVRYESGAQHHLPMHVDQSAMSVTLALNDAGEYDGGGTMFAAPVGETVRPGRGHVVAFKGGLQHGGSPVTRGTRYIVAAFLFAE